jgi:translation elongation factor EF-1beta
MSKTKLEKLQELDTLVLDKMIEWVKSDETDRLPELGNAITYIKANQVVEDKQKADTDPVEERKRKLEEVKKRREQV